MIRAVTRRLDLDKAWMDAREKFLAKKWGGQMEDIWDARWTAHWLTAPAPKRRKR